MSILSPIPIYPSQLDSFKYSAKSLAMALASTAGIKKWSAFVALDYLAKSIGYKGHTDLIQSTKFRSKSDQHQPLMLFGKRDSRSRICEFFCRELSIPIHAIDKACSLAFIEVMKLDMADKGILSKSSLFPMLTRVPEIIVDISEAPDHIIDAIEQHSQFLRFKQALEDGAPPLTIAGTQKQISSTQQRLAELTASCKEKLEQHYKGMEITFRIEKVRENPAAPQGYTIDHSASDQKDRLNIPHVINFCSKAHRPEGWYAKKDWMISLLISDCGTQTLDIISSWKPYRLFRNWLLSFSDTGHFQVIIRRSTDEEIFPSHQSKLSLNEIRKNLATEEDQLFFDICFSKHKNVVA